MGSVVAEARAVGLAAGAVEAVPCHAVAFAPRKAQMVAERVLPLITWNTYTLRQDMRVLKRNGASTLVDAPCGRGQTSII